MFQRTAVFVIALAGYACSWPAVVDSPQVSATGSGAPVDAKQLNRTDYEAVTGGVGVTGSVPGLCFLVREMPWMAAGLYMVKSLTGYTEHVSGEDAPTGYGAFTYVEMTQLEAWSPMAPSRTVARISGGPLKSGSTAGWLVHLRVGEPVGVLLMQPRPDNLDFTDLHPFGTFNVRADGGFGNDLFFTQRRVDEAELGSLIRGLWGGSASDPCPYDALPDAARNAAGSEDSQSGSVPPKFEVGKSDASTMAP